MPSANPIDWRTSNASLEMCNHALSIRAIRSESAADSYAPLVENPDKVAKQRRAKNDIVVTQDAHD